MNIEIDILPTGTEVRVKSSVLGHFGATVNGHFCKDGRLCYALNSRSWIYASEIVQAFTEPNWIKPD